MDQTLSFHRQPEYGVASWKFSLVRNTLNSVRSRLSYRLQTAVARAMIHRGIIVHVLDIFIARCAVRLGYGNPVHALP